MLGNHDGNASFSSKLYLTNVLYSHDFKLKLISITKLCNYLSCIIVFSTNNCVIQDMTT